MPTSLSSLGAHLKKAGYSITKPRREVFNLLAEKAPLTMHALWKDLESSSDRSSIYRTVALFESLGIVQRINHGWKYTLELSDDFIPHHHHFTCKSCGSVASFDEPSELDGMLKSLAKSNKFRVSAHTLEIEGLCAKCQPKTA